MSDSCVFLFVGDHLGWDLLNAYYFNCYGQATFKCWFLYEIIWLTVYFWSNFKYITASEWCQCQFGGVSQYAITNFSSLSSLVITLKPEVQHLWSSSESATCKTYPSLVMRATAEASFLRPVLHVMSFSQPVLWCGLWVNPFKLIIFILNLSIIIKN